MKYMYDAEPIFYQTSIMIASDEKFVSTHHYRAHISRGFPPSYKQCQLLTVKYRLKLNLIPVRNTTNNHEDKCMYQRSVTSDCWVYAMSGKNM